VIAGGVWRTPVFKMIFLCMLMNTIIVASLQNDPLADLARWMQRVVARYKPSAKMSSLEVTKTSSFELTT